MIAVAVTEPGERHHRCDESPIAQAIRVYLRSHIEGVHGRNVRGGATKTVGTMTRDPNPSSCLPVGAVIAVVEDDQSFLRALGRLLRAAGFTVQTFRSAEECLGELDATSPACMLLDIHLGGLSGFGLHERLRARGATVPTIFMTGQDDPATRERAWRLGAAGYLRKPFEDDALISAIEQAVASR